MTLNWDMIGWIVIGVAALAVAVVVILWLCGKISDEMMMRVWKKICYAVQAAEMMFGPDTGEQKLEWALNLLRSWGIKITDKVLAMLEAAVMELTHTNVPSKFDDDEEEPTEEIDGETADE